MQKYPNILKKKRNKRQALLTVIDRCFSLSLESWKMRTLDTSLFSSETQTQIFVYHMDQGQEYSLPSVKNHHICFSPTFPYQHKDVQI